MKKIGKSFSQELASAGLLGLPFSWGGDGQIIFGDLMTEAQCADVNAVYAAHDPDASAKANKWVDIKVERDRRQLDGGVKVGQHWFLSTDRATSEYNTIINTTRGIPDTTVVRAGWRTMDGAEVDMTPALALQILVAGIAQRCVIDDAALAHKAAMEASADPAAYDFSEGWPDIFGD